MNTAKPRGKGRGRDTRGRDTRGTDTRGRARVNARTIAWEVLRDVDVNDAYANLLLPAKLERTKLSSADAALCTEMTYGTLRARTFYDAVIEHIAGRPAADIEAPILAAMRLGAHQILSMRVADHAAVSETVGVVRYNTDEKNAQKAAGFVNAILRKVTEKTAEEWTDIVTESANEDTALEITTSHPAWIVRALRQALVAHGRSAEELPALLEAHNTPARVCMSILDGTRDETAGKLGAARTELSPIGITLEQGNPAKISKVAAGYARVQDEGSQLVALALTEVPVDDSESDPWLDLCAGPGGKTAVLASVAGSRRIDAVDVSEHRSKLVADSTHAFSNVRTHTADGVEYAQAHPQEYSRVLVDVPCSGLGALRRRPEARFRRQPSDIGTLGGVQRDLLKRAIGATRPGGVIAYTTCSPHVAETLMVVQEVVRKQPVTVLDAPQVLAELSGVDPQLFASEQVGDGRVAQMWPHVHTTDGMFLALVRRD